MKKIIAILGLLLYGLSFQAQTLTGGEYFFDTAPVLGGGNQFSFTPSDTVNQTLNVSVTSLSTGFHNMFVRVKNSGGIWSHYEGRLFYIIPPLPTVQGTLASGEWFVDTDPGLGNGTAIAFSQNDTVNQAVNISTTGLTTGFHYLFIRVKNLSGRWSHYEGRLFYIIPPLPTVQGTLALGEWFVDTDPGLGNGTAITFSQSDTVNQVVNINTTGFSTGFHNLFIRVKNLSGTWSHYEGRLFYVMPPLGITDQPMLASGEWFIDTDPGLGNGTAISFTPADSVGPIINVNTPSLSLGLHNLFIRVKNLSGIWSHYEGRPFTVQNCNLAITASVLGNDTICQGLIAIINSNSSTAGLTYQWYNNNTLLSTTDSVFSAANSGTYQVEATDGLGCLGYSNYVEITVKPLPAVTLTADLQTICAGETVTLTGEGAASYTWSGGADSTGITTASASPTATTTYTVTGIALGCSDTASVTVDVNPLPTVSAIANVLTADQAGALYQWIDCGNANAPIANETNQSYTALVSGTYAVIVTQNGCTDTSACFTFTSVGMAENSFGNQITIYPSPAIDIITITVNDGLIGQDYFITDEVGRTVLSGKLVSEKSVVTINELAAGIYIIKVLDSSKKIIK